jgi:hypothetical protein
MSSKHQDPQEGGMLHSSAAAFELRHETGGRSREERATAEEAPNEMAAKAAVTGGFTRRCGRRAPTDGRPCMHMFGHDGPHAWEL